MVEDTGTHSMVYVVHMVRLSELVAARTGSQVGSRVAVPVGWVVRVLRSRRGSPGEQDSPRNLDWGTADVRKLEAA